MEVDLMLAIARAEQDVREQTLKEVARWLLTLLGKDATMVVVRKEEIDTLLAGMMPEKE